MNAIESEPGAVGARAQQPRRFRARIDTIGAIGARACRGLADAWLARGCLLCAHPLAPHEDGFCGHCEAALPGASRPRCPVCAAASETPSRACARCAHEAPSFDRTVTLADYAPPLDRALLALKFAGQIALAAPLGRALGRALGCAPGQPLQTAEPAHHCAPASAPARAPARATAGCVRVTAVPLAPLRLAGRGFNQSAMIARAAARMLGARFEPALLARTRETPAQSLLALAGRRNNLAGAFVAAPLPHDATVVVVDDVMTSGATLDACALALKAAGARAVVNLVVARTA